MLDLGDQLEAEIALGRREYTVKETAGRTVSVWDYLNQREQLIAGDSGWRNLTALANSGVTLTNFFARRDGNLVHISCQLAATGTAGNITLANMPAGFAPSAKALRVGTASDRDGTSVRRISPYLSGIRILAMETGKNYEFGISYITDDAWPTVLPGTPA